MYNPTTSHYSPAYNCRLFSECELTQFKDQLTTAINDRARKEFKYIIDKIVANPFDTTIVYSSDGTRYSDRPDLVEMLLKEDFGRFHLKASFDQNDRRFVFVYEVVHGRIFGISKLFNAETMSEFRKRIEDARDLIIKTEFKYLIEQYKLDPFIGAIRVSSTKGRYTKPFITAMLNMEFGPFKLIEHDGGISLSI